MKEQPGNNINWQQRLQLAQAQNASFKIQLACTLASVTRKDMLERAERFQNAFLNKDLIISILRHDLAQCNNTPTATQDNYEDYTISMNTMEININELETGQLQLLRELEQFLSEARLVDQPS